LKCSVNAVLLVKEATRSWAVTLSIWSRCRIAAEAASRTAGFSSLKKILRSSGLASGLSARTVAVPFLAAVVKVVGWGGCSRRRSLLALSPG
jgi:hypothetical protein